MVVSFKKIGFILYTILWTLYFMQGAIWGEGGYIPQILLVLVLLWSLLHLGYAILHFSSLPNSLKALLVLLFSYVLYGIFPIIEHQELFVTQIRTYVPPFGYMKSALISITPVYSFYYFTKKGAITETYLKLFAIVFFISIVISYYAFQALQLQNAIKFGSDAREFTNNVSYDFIYLIPYIYLIKNKRNALIFLSAIAVYLIIGMKRGAIIIGLIGIAFYMKDLLANEKLRKKIYISLLIIATIILLSYVATTMYEQSPYFQYRVNQTLEGSTSTRDVIAESLLNYYFNKTTSLQILFGSGANATLLHAINFAHNDWLEMLIDQGAVGFLLLLSFYLYLFLDVRKMKRYDKLFYCSFRTMFVIIFTKTFFSMSICSMLPYLTLLMGYYLYMLRYYRQISEEEQQSSNICLK